VYHNCPSLITGNQSLNADVDPESIVLAIEGRNVTNRSSPPSMWNCYNGGGKDLFETFGAISDESGFRGLVLDNNETRTFAGLNFDFLNKTAFVKDGKWKSTFL